MCVCVCVCVCVCACACAHAWVYVCAYYSVLFVFAFKFWFAFSLTYPTHSFLLLTHSLTHFFTHSLSLTHSLTLALINLPMVNGDWKSCRIRPRTLLLSSKFCRMQSSECPHACFILTVIVYIQCFLFIFLKDGIHAPGLTADFTLRLDRSAIKSEGEIGRADTRPRSWSDSIFSFYNVYRELCVVVQRVASS
jgi:hypothetical protein